MKILVSSCLIGKKCAYDGKDRLHPEVKAFCESTGYIGVCPEILGGLPCPRERNEISGGTGEDVIAGDARVISSSGKDNTKAFLKGAEMAVEIAFENNISTAILKAHSPSCGSHFIHTGQFDGSLCEGTGVAAAMLAARGIRVVTEDEA